MNKAEVVKKGSVIVNKEMFYKDIFEKYYGKLCYYAQTFVSDLDTSKDIVQDLFVKLWEIELKNFSDEEIDKFLYKSTKNSCLDYIRKRNVRQNSRAIILEQLLDQEEIFIPQFELDELSQKIQKALNDLPKQTSVVFEMSRNQNKSYAEIAEELNITVKGVEYHISKALASLKLELKEFLPVIICILSLIKKS